VDGWYRDALEEDLHWFEEHLPVPPRERFVDGRGISWFLTGAQPSIARVWSIISILREHGVGVRKIRTRHPGRVIYEDRLQIVALPWRDTIRRIQRA
jgi:glutathione S-transferase